MTVINNESHHLENMKIRIKTFRKIMFYPHNYNSIQEYKTE